MLTVDDLRTHVTSSLEDGALEMLLAAAYGVIDERIGSGEDVTELITAGPGPLFMLSRKPRAIVSVAEGTTDLDPTDYAIRGRFLLRLDTGPNPNRWWRGWIDVTYTPEVSEDMRDSVAVALVKLDLNQEPGRSSERIGDWTETIETGKSVAQQRDEILALLSGQTLVLL
jgi:hypothetical protein